MPAASEPADPIQALPAASPWKELIRGLSRPSGGAVTLALLINVAWITALCAAVTPGRLAGGLDQYLARSERDDDVFAAAKAFRMRSLPATTPLVVATGASAELETLDEGDLAAEFAARGFEGVAVLNTATSRQPFTDAMKLVEQIPDGSRGVVVVGIGPSRLTAGREVFAEALEAPRLPIRSEYETRLAAEFGVELPWTTGIYALDHARFLAPRMRGFLSRVVKHRPVQHITQKYVGLGRSRGAKWTWRGEMVAERLEHYDAHVDLNLGVLRDIVVRIRERTEMRVLLVEHCVNPRFVAEFTEPGTYDAHIERVRRFAEGLGVPYVHLREAAGVQEEDFHDWCHLRSRIAIQQCAGVVAERAAPLLRASLAGEDR